MAVPGAASAAARWLNDALDLALASAPPAGAALRPRGEESAQKALPPLAQGSVLAAEDERWWLRDEEAARAPPLGARRALPLTVPPPPRSHAGSEAPPAFGVSAQLDAALREVSFCLDRARLPSLLPVEEHGLAAVRAAAAGAALRARATAARAFAVRALSARCRAQLGAERASAPLQPAVRALAAAPERLGADGGAARVLCDERPLAFTAQPQQRALPAASARAHAAPLPACDAMRSEARGGRAPVRPLLQKGLARSPAASLHSALHKREQRAAAAWGSDEDE
jgi:hypothetical protein